jgi:hypothetical protein
VLGLVLVLLALALPLLLKLSAAVPALASVDGRHGRLGHDGVARGGGRRTKQA